MTDHTEPIHQDHREPKVTWEVRHYGDGWDGPDGDHSTFIQKHVNGSRSNLAGDYLSFDSDIELRQAFADLSTLLAEMARAIATDAGGLENVQRTVVEGLAKAYERDDLEHEPTQQEVDAYAAHWKAALDAIGRGIAPAGTKTRFGLYAAFAVHDGLPVPPLPTRKDVEQHIEERRRREPEIDRVEQVNLDNLRFGGWSHE